MTTSSSKREVRKVAKRCVEEIVKFLNSTNTHKKVDERDQSRKEKIFPHEGELR